MATPHNAHHGVTIVEALIAIAAASTLSGVFWLIYHDHGWIGVAQLIGIIIVIILLAILDGIGQQRKAAEAAAQRAVQARTDMQDDPTQRDSLNLSLEDAITITRKHVAKCYPGACVDESNIHPYAYGWIIGFGIPCDANGTAPPTIEPLIPGPSCLYFNKHTGRFDDHDSTHDWMLTPEEMK